jgi:hypothetical protein
VDRVGRHLGRVVIEGGCENLEGKARRDAVHAFVDPGRILVFLHAARLRIAILEALAVVDAHLGEDGRVLVPAQT